MNSRLIVAFLIGAMIAACGESEAPPSAPEPALKTVSGTVVFRENIGLTPASRMEIRVLDVSLAGVPSTEIASLTVDQPGQSPLPFSVQIDAAMIDEQRSYSVSAKIFDRDQLIVLSDTVVPVLTRGAPDEVEVFVVRTSQNRRTHADASVTGTRWFADTILGKQTVNDTEIAPPYLVLNNSDGTVSGFAGCNQFNGSFSQAANSLTIGNIAATMMACPNGAEIEASFMSVLADIDEIRIEGRTMRAYADSALVASFTAAANDD